MLRASVLAASLAVCGFGSGCKDKESPAASTPPPAAEAEAPAAAPAAGPAEAKSPCTVPAASAAHVAKVLGLGPLTGPTLRSTGVTQKCEYKSADGEMVAIEYILDAKASDLDYARKQIETYFPGTTRDYPGFGDNAFSHTSSTKVGKKMLVQNSIGVLQGKTLVHVGSEASLDKIRALATDFLRDVASK